MSFLFKRMRERQKRNAQINAYKRQLAAADEFIKNLEQQKKKLSFFDFKNKKKIKAKIKTVKQQKKEIEEKLKKLENEKFTSSVIISPCSFQLIKIIIAVLFLVLLIKIYSHLSDFSSISEIYTTRPETKINKPF